MGEDSDSLVKILIEFGLDDTSAKQAVAVLEQVKQSTSAATTETSKLADAEEAARDKLFKGGEVYRIIQANKAKAEAAAAEAAMKTEGSGKQMEMGFAPEGWEGMEKYKDKIGEANEHTKSLHGSVTQLRSMMSGAGPVARELGHLLHFALNPAMLGGVALSAGLQEYFHLLNKALERQKEMNKALYEFNKFQHEIIKLNGDIWEGQNKYADSISETTAKLHGLGDSLHHFEVMAKNFDTSYRDAQNERIRAHKEELDLVSERLGMLEKMGRLTSDQVTQDKLILDLRQKQEENVNEIAKAQTEIKLATENYKDELKKAGGEKAFSPEAIASASVKVQETERSLAQARALAGEKGLREMEDLDRKRAENRSAWNRHGTEWDVATGQLKGVGYRAQDEAFMNQQTLLKREIAAAQASLQGLAQSAAEAKENLKSISGLHDKFEGMKESISDLRQHMVDDQSALPTKQRQAFVDYATKSTSANLGKESTQQIFTEAATALKELGTMKQRTGYSPQDYLTRGNMEQAQYVRHLQDQVTALQNLETALGENGPQQINLLNNIVLHFGNLNYFYNKLQAQVNGIVATGTNVH